MSRSLFQRLFGATARDWFGRHILLVASLVASLVIAGIFILLWIEASPALFTQGLGLLGPIWDPNSGLYGISVFVAGTVWVSGLALILAMPLGIATAVFLSEYCPNRLRRPLRMVMEFMAAIPSIVYGLWGLKTLVPALRATFRPIVGDYSGYGVLAGAIILAVMLLPTIVAVSDDAMQMVPDSLREASYALGASRTETARRVVLSTALPGIGAAVLLSLGRAIGETMAVYMVTGNSLMYPAGIFDQSFVMTSVITAQLGYALSNPLYRSALFAVALVLLLISIMFTILAKLVIRWGMRRRGLK
ncbi:MAG: phosphate ABC transporter permease subunit PstC [Promethearchaeota archaeon]